jgi:hypothetical protein
MLALRVLGLVRHFYWEPLLIAPMEKILSNKKGWLLSGYYNKLSSHNVACTL